MSIFKFITLLFNIRIWFSEKWDLLFPIKEIYGLINNNIENISFIYSNKQYEKILIKYEIKSKIYRIIYDNTNLNTIKKISITKIPFSTGLHKPIIYIKIKYNKYEKRHIISYLIPLFKEYKQTTRLLDFILFNIKDKNFKTFYKIYIQTFNKMFCFKYNQLININILEFYKLLK
jgi:hypothetical protein